jgi:hypothetical protein
MYIQRRFIAGQPCNNFITFFLPGVNVYSLKPLCLLLSAIGVAPAVFAAEPVQKVKPPVAQVWIDLATYSGGMPAIPAGGALGMVGSMFSSGGTNTQGNVFGNTQTGSAGRWMDVTMLTRKNPGLMSGQETAPEAGKFGSPLKLVAPQDIKPEPVQPEENTPVEANYEMPKGKMYLYWGCSAEVRKGQPLVLDMSTMDRTQMARFFQNRGATSRVPSPGPGRPVWPNKTDDRMVPATASLVGEHTFTGEGVPEGFAVKIGANHDLMPPIDAKRSEEGNAVLFKWQAMAQARAWFISSMGARLDGAKSDKGEMEMVFWTSSELPDMGAGLLNYQPNAAIDKWIKEKVVLPAKTTECMAPKEAVGPMSVTRMIAYGDEMNVAYPPRPKDPKITWEPEWSAKVRLKSVATLMPGMAHLATNAVAAERGGTQQPAAQEPGSDTPANEGKKSLLENAAKEVFKGLFNRK